MTFARTANTGGFGTSTSISIAATAYASVLGRLVVGYVSWESGNTTVGVTDTAGNTYVVGTPVVHANVDQIIAPFYCLSSKGHATNIVTATFGATRGYRGIQIAEYSKASPAIADGYGYGGSTASTTVTTATVNTTGASGLLFAGTKTFNVSTITAGGSMSLIAQQGNYNADAEKFLVSAGAYTASMTGSVSTSLSCVAMAFREGESVTSITGSSVTEGAALRFTVALSGTTGQTGDYTYSFGGTAVAVTDYDSDLANATFSAGASYVGAMIRVQSGYSSFTVDVATSGNALDQDDRTLVLTVGGTASTGGLITDNDAPPVVTFTDGVESFGVVTCVATLGAVSGKDVSFQVDTTNGTKTAGTHYTAIVAQTVTIPAGSLTAAITANTL